MTRDLGDWAARNNAGWCDAVCRAHGHPGEFSAGIWVNRHPTPRFYPNAVTLRRTGAADQRARIAALAGAGLASGWAVKDSFARIDLAQAGFQVLFEAEWLWRPADLAKPAGAEGIRWEVLREAGALAEWETAWNGGPLANEPSIFLPELLADRSTRFLAATQAQQICGGAIAYQTGPVVGLSNVFSLKKMVDWAGCVSAVMNLFPGLALVDYEHGEDLVQAQAVGFTPVGPLRIWAMV